MPIHQWSKVDPDLFHHFHQRWSIAICDALNAGLLPEGYSALIEQHAQGLVPDVLTVERGGSSPRGTSTGALLATLPRTSHAVESKENTLADRANRIAIRHQLGEVVAILEIVSPGNKSSKSAFRKFVAKAVEFLSEGVHLLIIDLFPPTPRDPLGIHRAIWDELYEEDPYRNPPRQPLTVVSYQAGGLDRSTRAFVEPLAYGEKLPDMPMYLDHQYYVFTPLEQSYQQSWDVCPAAFKQAILAAES
jgi:hypothetical protein